MADLFSAKEPSLGYFYQVVYGLYLLLTPSSKENPLLSIETLDDIVLEDADGEIDLHQTKFHRSGTANLTDRSSDFWKTIRVWAKRIDDNSLNPKNSVFCLITTECTSESSILYKLKARDKSREQIEAIESELLEITKEKSNQTNQKGYSAFSKLSPENRKALIRNIQTFPILSGNKPAKRPEPILPFYPLLVPLLIRMPRIHRNQILSVTLVHRKKIKGFSMFGEKIIVS